MDTISFNPVMLALLLTAVTYAVIYLLQKKQVHNKKGLQMAMSQSTPPAGIPPFTNLIPPAAPEPEFELSLELPEDDDSNWELIEDDTSILLKEAESVTTQISAVIAGIASDPANPDEVFSKISAIVSQYKIFVNTEFFDAINRYIAVTVERELHISFNTQQLTELWD